MLLALPSWRWLLLFVVLAGLITAVLLLFTKPNDRTNVRTKLYMDVVLAVITVAACVRALAMQYALLPREHSTICDRPGSEGIDHHLTYITEEEMATLVKGGGWGHPKPGMFGTQGVSCFPKRPREDESSDDARSRPMPRPMQRALDLGRVTYLEAMFAKMNHHTVEDVLRERANRDPNDIQPIPLPLYDPKFPPNDIQQDELERAEAKRDPYQELERAEAKRDPYQEGFDATLEGILADGAAPQRDISPIPFPTN